MTAFTLAAMTFVCTFGSALLATVIRARLPAPHLSKESQDVVRLGMGLVATMTALLLGLVTSAAKGSFDSQDVAVRNAAASIVTLDRLLARYGPETKPTRDALRAIVAARVEATWSKNFAERNGLESVQGPPPAETIENQILQLSPANDTQRWFKSEALKLTADVLKTRWRLLGSVGSVSRAFVMVVIFWLTMTFASFGLYAPRNATVVAVLFIAAFSVAAAVFLILELDDPFAGVITISSRPMRNALDNLGL